MKINMTAKDYAEYSGYPLKTIKDYCKAGVIPSDRIGRTYLINVDLADKQLLERMTQKHKHKRIEIMTNVKQNFNFIESLKNA